MARATARPPLMLSPEESARLKGLAASRTSPVREVQRAKLLLGYHGGQSFSSLSRSLGMTRRIACKHVDRALAAGADVALRDWPHGSKATITPQAKARAIALACRKPKDHRCAAELWTRSALARHVRIRAEGTTIRVILDSHSAHISKETMTYLATRSNPFLYVHTPRG